MTFQLLSTEIRNDVVLIEASAGTGKTYTITGLYLRLLLEDQITDVEQILVVTFTNAATDALKSRIRDVLTSALECFDRKQVPDALIRDLCAQHPGRRQRIVDALRGFDRAAISTIHGFCKRVLEENAFESGAPYGAELLQDSTPLHEEASADALRQLLADNDPLLAAVIVLAGITHISLSTLYGTWYRIPGTRVIPPEPGGLDLETADMAALSVAVSVACQSLASAMATASALADSEALQAEARVIQFAKQKKVQKAGGLSTLLIHAQRQNAVGLQAMRICTTAILSVEAFKKTPLEAHPHLVAFAAACTEVAVCIAATVHAIQCLLLRTVFERVQQLAAERNLQTFDDLLRRLHRAILDPASQPALVQAIGGRFRIALIDEFQDTDRAQYEIFCRAFATKPLFLIGDPKQAIYGFRGADIHTYLAARNAAQSRHTLTQNWRSTQQMIDAVGDVFAAPDAFVFEGITFEPIEAAGKVLHSSFAAGGDTPGRNAALHLWYVPFCVSTKADNAKGGRTKGGAAKADCTESEPLTLGPRSKEAGFDIAASRIAAECVRLLQCATIEGSRLRPGQIAVLTKTNYETTLIRDALQRCGVPAVVSQVEDVMQTREAEDLSVLMDAMATPRDLGLVRAALAGMITGMDGPALQALVESEESLSGDPKDVSLALQLEAERFEALHIRWQQDGFFSAIEQALVSFDTACRWLANPDGERRLTNLRHLIELLHTEACRSNLTIEGLRRRFTAMRQQPADAETREQRLETDEEAVQILTMHKSKGLEYDVVFLPSLWSVRNERSIKQVLLRTKAGAELHLGDDLEGRDRLLEAYRKETLASDLRLAYVAMTRARHRTYLVCGGIGMSYPQSPLAHLLFRNLPAEEWPGQLETLVQMSEGRIHLTVADAPVPPCVLPAPTSPTIESKARTFRSRPSQLVPWRMSSFTSLTKGFHQFDETPDLTAALAPQAEDTGGDPTPCLLPTFERGGRAGTCLHTILEHIDFQQVDSASTAATVKTTLEQHGLAGQDTQVLSMLRTVLSTMLPFGFRLNDLPRTARFDEWEFFLQMADGHASALHRLLTDHDVPLPPFQTAHEAAADSNLAGFLTGKVDLLCTFNDKIFLLDWKSNDLGTERRNYDRQGMAHAVLMHRYALQYHLYLVALHRHLSRTMKEYQYDRSIGGVAYVFLRGVGGTAPDGSGTGIYVDRPPFQVIEALDRFFTGAAGDQAMRTTR